MKDILIACIDGLSGFTRAISAVFPKTEIQLCIIHQIRNSTKFVSYKDLKALMTDLKKVYTASTEEIALMELDRFSKNWDKNTFLFQSRREKWTSISTYFKYLNGARKIIYTTNTV